MNAVLISIQPKWCELIASGKKTIEVRKTKPKLETPFKVYIYCTQARKPIREDGRILLYEDDLAITNRRGRGKKIENPHGCLKEGELLLNGKVIGEFVCNNIDRHGLANLIVKEDAEHTLSGTCLTKEEVLNYLGYQKGTNIYACKNYDFYGWHISNLVIYDKPRELREFSSGSSRLEFSNTEDGFPLKWSGIKRPPQSWCYVETTSQTERGE